jgi:hypothetical protein
MSRGGGGGRRLLGALSRVSMVAGVVLFVIGMSLRLGVLEVAGAGGPGPAASDGSAALGSPASVGSTAPSIGQPTGEPTIDPTPAPTPAPTPEPTPAPTATADAGELVFADDFDTEAAWPVGRLDDWTTARYQGGWYVLAANPIDLPDYVAPASSDVPPGSTLGVAATLIIDGPDARAGVYAVDAHGTKIAALVSPGGRVELIRDSVEQLDGIGRYPFDTTGGPVQLALAVGPLGTVVAVDGTVVATVDARLEPVGFGLAVWAQPSSATVSVDRFEARLLPTH